MASASASGNTRSLSWLKETVEVTPIEGGWTPNVPATSTDESLESLGVETTWIRARTTSPQCWPMLSRFERFNQTRKDKDHRSKLEDQVEQALLKQGLTPKYEPDKFDYTLHRRYCPDFKIGDVYIEVKGWWPSAERTKFLSVIRNNPDLRIFVALQRPSQRLSKQSKTTLRGGAPRTASPGARYRFRLTSSINGSTGNDPPSMPRMRKHRRRDGLPGRVALLLLLPRPIPRRYRGALDWR